MLAKVKYFLVIFVKTKNNTMNKRKVVKSVDAKGNKKKVVTRRSGTVVTKTDRDNGTLGTRKAKRVTKADGTSKTKSTVKKTNGVKVKSKTSYNADGSVKVRKVKTKSGSGSTKSKSMTIQKTVAPKKLRVTKSKSVVRGPKNQNGTFVQKKKTSASGVVKEKQKETRLGKQKAKNKYTR